MCDPQSVQSLEDFYRGKKVKLNLTKKVICLECDGKGVTEESAVEKCAECDGSGVKVFPRLLLDETCKLMTRLWQMFMRQIGPGMVQSSQAATA